MREELFGIERLEQHAETLAAAQTITAKRPSVPSLHTRLNDNAAVLLAAYRASAAELEHGDGVVPAAEWLLDNYHLVEEQIREIRNDLPPGYYRILPKLAGGPFGGYPRVLGLAWAFVAHTDSHFDPEILRRFIMAYQRVQPLTIGELWAVAITLRIVLIENLRRLADQIIAGQQARAEADMLADRLLMSLHTGSALDAVIVALPTEPLSERFAAQFAKRLRDQDPKTTPAYGWLEERLHLQGLTIDEVVHHVHARQGGSNVSVRNVITSMRLISDIDWAELFESVSLVDAKWSAESDFAAMDFPTRNLYRSAVEQLARGARCTELDVVERTLVIAQQAVVGVDDAIEKARLGDPGYHLIGKGRAALEHSIGFRPNLALSLARLIVEMGIGGYVGNIVLVSFLLMAAALWALAARGVDEIWLLLVTLLGLLPASELASALINRMVTKLFGAVALPGIELDKGVPESLRSLVVVPTLLANEADLIEQVERLEVHHLAGAGGELAFALLTDGVDADSETVAGDAELLTKAAQAIAQLNRRYAPAAGGDRFLLLHRRRIFNASENKWMGWERKRGKLQELNRLLRGATDTSFMPIEGVAPRVPQGVRYVITLDADTRLPRDAALRLIGKMAHPLNRPKFDANEKRVVDGYAILQPRVTPALPVGHAGSLFQRIFSGPGGIDPYAAAISDVYQDLFGEGSYTGKGIYDVDAFEAAMAGRAPENALLSHDLFEGIFGRAGLASDIEFVDEFPSRYDVAAKRQHRWTRGDWQLLPWLFGKHRVGVPAIGHWKMLDNLRRSLFAPFALSSLALAWLLPWPAAAAAAIFVIATIAVPALLPLLSAVFPDRPGIRLRNHLFAFLQECGNASLQIFLTLAFLPDQAWRMADAILRTIVRLVVSHRHLLEWTTAAQTAGAPRPGVSGFYREMIGGTALGLGLALGTVALMPSSWPLVLPFAVLWLTAPLVAWASSRARRVPKRDVSSPIDAQELRLIARRTWRFFETFVTPADNMLPPDNFQEEPKPVVARRTSPTNIGLYLLSSVAARDFGWAGTIQTVERLEAAFATLARLTRFRGHFFNWYDIGDLRPLEPAYVSAVDSGNLAGHLLALANACEEWTGDLIAPMARLGLRDDLQMIRELFETVSGGSGEARQQLAAILQQVESSLNGASDIAALAPEVQSLCDRAARAARALLPPPQDDSDLQYWIGALAKTMAEHARDRQSDAADLRPRLQALAATARIMALEMDFAFLVDPERKLLSIGYSRADNSLDASCYDLLASEARLASLFAIAKGDAPTRHWFRLGRTAIPLGNGSALVSWSGSMFEYLMPSLVMRAPIGSLLEQSNRLVVERQQSYAKSLGVPWGISESGYNARDREFTYQYSNFGVPGLGLKRGLAENLVIAPYATGLATMVDPQGSRQNYARLAELGAKGRYGFYEALDFTRARLPDSLHFVVVRNFMAHHQGMTIVSIANALHDGAMRSRFHREPMIQAAELLLQERMPREVAAEQPHAEEVKSSPAEISEAPVVRRVPALPAGAPVTHLLSNGTYTVMLTSSGAGYSRWRDIAVTRWREDSTKDDWGSFVFLRDLQAGTMWSASVHPAPGEMDSDDVMFGEDRAEFTRRSGSLSTVTDVVVSSEDDGEVRRVCLIN
ncbi:MAG: glucoamylase family protein, partial [Rhodospirillales bacterium]